MNPQGPDPLQVIQVRASCVIANGYVSNPNATRAALDDLEHQIRQAVGGVVPEGWRRHVKYIPSAHGLLCRVEFQAIKHEHRLQKRFIFPGCYVEECLTFDCDFRGDLVQF